MHPTPSPKRCLVETEDGRIFFDANADPAPAKDVPAEAHRRFRDDLRVTREQNLKTRAEQMAQHEEKKKFAADWIAAHGTPDQQVRQAAGVLSIEEAIDAMNDYAFGPLADTNHTPRHDRKVPLTDSQLWRCRFLIGGFWHPNGEDHHGNEGGRA